MLDPRPRSAVPAVPRILAAAEADADGCLDVLALAFAADPGVRWMFPDATAYGAHFRAFARAFGGQAFALGTAEHIPARAVALWLPPGALPDEEALVQTVQLGAPPAARAQALELFDAMGRWHPNEPHWYLPLIGAVPASQGRGLGAALLAHRLAKCDDEGLPAYLEATSERSVPLYQRHGFEVLTVLRVGTCPPIVPMVRRPRPTRGER